MVIGGGFNVAGTVVTRGLAMWDPASGRWSDVGGGLSGGDFPTVYALAVLPDGRLVAGGSFTEIGGVPASGIAVYDGTSWSSLGAGVEFGTAGDPTVYALAVSPGGDLAVGGDFLLAGGLVVPLAITVTRGGLVFLGGEFTSVGGVAVSNIARWNGNAWSDLGAGITEGDGGSSAVFGLAARPDGEVLVTGRFFKAGGRASVNFARCLETPPVRPR